MVVIESEKITRWSQRHPNATHGVPACANAVVPSLHVPSVFEVESNDQGSEGMGLSLLISS